MKATKLGSLLFILLIAVVFTLQFGPGSSGCGNLTPGDPNAVATVNGEEITSLEFRRAYANQLVRLRQAGIPESQARLFGLPQQTLNGLVDEALLSQAAKQAGIKPSDDELRKQLWEIQAFHKDGKFNFERYHQEVTQRFGKTPQAFEAELRESLAAQRMLALVEESAAVSESEVKARFFREEDQVALEYVRFQPAQFTDDVKPPTAQELATFREANAAAIKADYEKDQFVYSQPERIKARQILVKIPENATAEQKEQAKQKAQQLREQIEGGKDFATVAQASSDDLGSRGKGGELGWVQRGSWDAALADAAFPLEVGGMTQPIETRAGFHLIKVEEKQAPRRQELAEVQDQIATKLWSRERAKELARQAADAALVQAKSSDKTLVELFPKATETAAGAQPPQTPEAMETQAFSTNTEFVPTLGPAPELVKAASAVQNAPVLLEKSYPVGEGFVIARATLRKRATEADYAAKKDEFRNEAVTAKKFELREQYLKSLREKGNVKLHQEIVDQLVGQG